MKIDISFDGLPKEEKLEIAKEVVNSNDLAVRRIIEESRSKSMILNSKAEGNPVDEMEKYLQEVLKLLSDRVLIEYLENHEIIPQPVLEKILVGRNGNVIIWAINSKLYGEHFRKQYYKSAEEKIRIAIVECEDTDENMLIEMAKYDKSSKVRCALASVSYESVLIILCNDCSSEQEKRILAENPNTPEEFLKNWAKDGGAAIWRALLKNKNIPQKAISYIYYKTSSSYILEDCINNPNCSSEVLCKYITKNRYVLLKYSDRVLGHPNASAEVVESFANACIKEYKKSVRNDKDIYLRLLRKAYMHKNASDELKKKIDEI